MFRHCNIDLMIFDIVITILIILRTSGSLIRGSLYTCDRIMCTMHHRGYTNIRWIIGTCRANTICDIITIYIGSRAFTKVFVHINKCCTTFSTCNSMWTIHFSGAITPSACTCRTDSSRTENFCIFTFT